MKVMYEREGGREGGESLMLAVVGMNEVVSAVIIRIIILLCTVPPTDKNNGRRINQSMSSFRIVGKLNDTSDEATTSGRQAR